MAKPPKKKEKPEELLVAQNRAASYNYHLLEKLEAGMVLLGTEVKSLREGKANLRDAYAVIRGNAELLRMNAVPGGDDEKWIESIIKSSRLLQVRLEHLMAAVRNGSGVVQVIDLPPLIQEAIDLFVKGLPPVDQPVQVTAACEGPLPKVRVDPGRLMQVLLNLLSNGRDAIARIAEENRFPSREAAKPKKAERHKPRV